MCRNLYTNLKALLIKSTDELYKPKRNNENSIKFNIKVKNFI